MTVVVGVVSDGTVYMGADSAGISGWDLVVRKDPKVFRKGEMLIGFTTSFRMGQLLHHAFEPPPVEGDLSAYMVTTFVNALRDCFKAGGYARKNNEEEAAGTFMVGLRGRLFVISDDYQVVEPAHVFAAVGCGSSYALGSLYATRSMSPQTRICLALETAEAFSAGVRGPFTILSTEGSNEHTDN